MADGSQVRLKSSPGSVNGKAVPSAKLINLTVLDELIWPADPDDRNRESKLIQRFENR